MSVRVNVLVLSPWLTTSIYFLFVHFNKFLYIIIVIKQQPSVPASKFITNFDISDKSKIEIAHINK